MVGPDPYGSIYHDAFYKGEWDDPGLYRVEGIGHDFMVGTLDFSVIDEVVNVSDRDSFLMARSLARHEGFSPEALRERCFTEHFRKPASKEPGKIVVAIVCDSGDRYISKAFNDEWMRDMGFFAPEQHLGTVADILRTKETRKWCSPTLKIPSNPSLTRWHHSAFLKCQ
ncbi:MAG: hypothetical protein CM1200mP20_08310 [Pseudomonadota bacterium]|nr:MAG: hypothetical protein CM1200mP20_08310 [Pseudomonadota bacterium]